MEAEIKEDKVLEFKALTMSKRVFEQTRRVMPDEVQGEGTDEAKFIGWVHDGIKEWFVGKAHGTLVRVERIDMWQWLIDRLGGMELVKTQCEKGNIRQTEYLNREVDKYRNSLPQIFIK